MNHGHLIALAVIREGTMLGDRVTRKGRGTAKTVDSESLGEIVISVDKVTLHVVRINTRPYPELVHDNHNESEPWLREFW